MNIIKDPNKMICPSCKERAFGINMKAKGKYKNMLICTECGHKEYPKFK